MGVAVLSAWLYSLPLLLYGTEYAAWFHPQMVPYPSFISEPTYFLGSSIHNIWHVFRSLTLTAVAKPPPSALVHYC